MNIVLARLYGSLLILLGVLSLSSCSTSTSPQKSRYYLLNSHYSQQQVTNPLTRVIDKTVVVSVLELPAYLHQPYLVLQLDAHQLHYARFDMWAEPLQQGFLKALLVDLNNGSSTSTFIDGNQLASELTLVINIERFHVTDSSGVTLAGHYRLTDQVGSLPFNKRTFNLRT